MDKVDDFRATFKSGYESKVLVLVYKAAADVCEIHIFC